MTYLCHCNNLPNPPDYSWTKLATLIPIETSTFIVQRAKFFSSHGIQLYSIKYIEYRDCNNDQRGDIFSI